MTLNDDDITSTGVDGAGEGPAAGDGLDDPALEGPADGGAAAAVHDGGADGGATGAVGGDPLDEGVADGGAIPEGHDGGADGGASSSA